jgi:FtsP/CotA-like multicopper oxidase with cupredoxin domain
MNRRDFLRYTSIASLGLASCQTQAGTVPITRRPLPIPPLRPPTVRDGVDHYDLTIREGEHPFFDGVATRTYAIDGSWLGPTLLLRRGRPVSINYTNRLPETTTMHGHGMHVPARMDGTAHQPIAPGAIWSSVFTVDQRACTNWYHPHAMGKTAEHVYKGVAGLIIIEDDESRSLNLPRRYGVDDIPLVLQDRRFVQGQIDYRPSMPEIMHGFVGETFLANGAIDPIFDAEAKELRLRILNGSNSSIYALGFVGEIPFHQIATDNAFLETPIALTRLVLSPGERAEVVIDLSAYAGKSLALYDYYNGKSFLTIRVSKKARPPSPSCPPASPPSSDSTRPKRSAPAASYSGGV